MLPVGHTMFRVLNRFGLMRRSTFHFAWTYPRRDYYIFSQNRDASGRSSLRTICKRFKPYNVRYHLSETLKKDIRNAEEAQTVTICYIDRDRERHFIEGKVGDNVMYLAQRHGLDVEGACEASLACCTCHVYVKDEFYDKLDEPTEEEEDMLDLAPFLQENSRLSCQIILSTDIDGIEVQLPSATRNFYVDGHKPKHH